jgi:hypothetical protein
MKEKAVLIFCNILLKLRMGRQVVTGKYLPMFRRKLQMEAADE